MDDSEDEEMWSDDEEQTMRQDTDEDDNNERNEDNDDTEDANNIDLEEEPCGTEEEEYAHWNEISRLRVVDLKKRLRECGETTTGIKPELIARLLVHEKTENKFQTWWKEKTTDSRFWNSNLITQLWKYQFRLLYDKHISVQLELEHKPEKRLLSKVPQSLEFFFKFSKTPTEKWAFSQ